MRSRGWCASAASRRDPTLVTHLASADEVEDPKTQQQLDSFEAATRGTAGRAQRRELGRDPRLARVAWRLGATRADALRRLSVCHEAAVRTSACGR